MVHRAPETSLSGLGAALAAVAARVVKRGSTVPLQTGGARTGRRRPATGDAPVDAAVDGILDARGFRALVETAFGHDHGCGLLYLELQQIDFLRATFGRDAVTHLVEVLAVRLQADLRRGDGLAVVDDSTFAILIRGLTDRASFDAIVERLRAGLGMPVFVAGTRFRPSWVAAGVVAPLDGHTPAELLAAAEAARDVARAGEGETVVAPAAAARSDLEQRRQRLRELLEAKDAGAFFPVFQPQLDLATGRVDRVEVLMRWQRADGTVDGPARFLDELREIGALPAVSLEVYASALAEAALWRAHGHNCSRVALNLDACQVAAPAWAERLLAVIARSPLPATAVEFEISENILARADLALLAEGLATLRDAGVHISLDDFGQGYASLTQLARLPIDLVKLDARLLWEADRSSRGHAVIEGTVALMRRLDLPCVFEGIETPAQLALARALGGRVGQGYFIGRPMSGHDCEALLTRSTPARPQLERCRAASASTVSTG